MIWEISAVCFDRVRFHRFYGRRAGSTVKLWCVHYRQPFVSMSDMMGMSGNLSRIPLWLAFAAIGFAIFVGMAAGFMPAMRAMKLSPLAAIRNE